MLIVSFYNLKFVNFHQVYGESESRVRTLAAVHNELDKFEDEVGKFDTWMNEADNTLRAEQRAGGDVERLRDQAEKHKARQLIWIAISK